MQNKVFSCAHSEVPPPAPYPTYLLTLQYLGETLTWAGLSSFAMPQQWFLTLAAYWNTLGNLLKMQIPWPHPSDS